MNTNTNEITPTTSTEMSTKLIPVKVSMQTPRVFVLHTEQHVDITSAMEYGPIIPLFKSGEPKENRPSIWRDEFVDEVIRRMEKNEYNPAKDYILVAGFMAGLIIWIANVIREWHEDCEHIKLLMWNGRDAQYIEILV